MFDPIIISTNRFLADAVALMQGLTPLQLVVMLWPFLFLSLPRYVIAELLVLSAVFRPEPAAKARFRKKLAVERPLVSVLLPGYNEADTLENAVMSLREQSYPNLEIIVVNDGSTDGMGEVGRRLAERGWIRYFELNQRGGKSAGTNFAVNASRGEFVVVFDSDSTADRDAIWHLLVEFYRPEVMAVAGNLRARNTGTNLLTRAQALQYLISIGIGRRGSAGAGTLSIVSGAFGAMRRSIIDAVGGWEAGPGEDSDFTIKICIAGGEVAFAPRAICMTDVPDDWWTYYRQQMRWNQSSVRFRLRKYRWVLNPFSRAFNTRNLLAALDELVFEVFFAISLPIYITWMLIAHPDIFWLIFTFVALLYMVLNYFHFLVVLAVSERPLQDLKLFPYVILYGLFTGVYLRTVRLIAYADEYFFRRSYTESYVPDYVQRQSRNFDAW